MASNARRAALIAQIEAAAAAKDTATFATLAAQYDAEACTATGCTHRSDLHGIHGSACTVTTDGVRCACTAFTPAP